MRRASKLRILLLTALLPMVACHGVSWPSERIVRSLRVLAVQAEPASVTPGQSSQLSLLCVDSIDSPDDNIEGADAGVNPDIDVAWFGACDNPPNNDPSKCLGQYAGWLDRISPVLADHSLSSTLAQFQVAQTFQYNAPENVLQNEVTVGGVTIHYGNSYVYFAACAGKLVPAAGLTDQLPVQCRDRSSNALLDQSRFVVGVTTIYAYDKILNHNPLFPVPRNCSAQSLAQCAMQQPPQYASAVPYSGKACSVDSDCYAGSGSAVATVGGVPAGWACASNVGSDGVCAPLVHPCTNNVPGSCGLYDIGVELGVASFFLTGLDETLIFNPPKSLWIDCYSNTGAWPDDPHHGLSAPSASEFVGHNISKPADLDNYTAMDGCGYWQPPTQPTDQARVWAVIRDDRGGIGWLEKRVVVR
jgi:hypothetical protein